MTKKKTTPRKKHNHTYELDAWYDGETPGWGAVLTWYQDGNAMISTQAQCETLMKTVQTVQDAMYRAQSDLRDEKLILPDMGDFQIRYHADWKDLLD